MAAKRSGPSHVWFKSPCRGGMTALDRHNIRTAIEASLMRLQTDYVDLYQTHWPDHDAPYEEMMDALDELVREGKVRILGCSNETSWGLMKSLAASEKLGVARYHTIQNNFSLNNRRFEDELAQVCRQEGVSLIPYSPLAGGVLSGKYQGGATPEGARFSRYLAMEGRQAAMGRRFVNDKSLAATERYLAIAAEAGVDDFLAEATPEDKLALIRREQAEGRLVAMCGDGTNDAPALAQADVGVAMNTGTQAAREAGNMVDLDSDPTKLIEVVGLGKQLLMTRGALTTFSVANDVAKYFAIIPAIFVFLYPELGVLNVMRLATPESAVLSAIIFNALIIPCLVPLALKGVRYRPMPAGPLLARNLSIFGLGGLVAPFVGIKLIDLAVSGLQLA